MGRGPRIPALLGLGGAAFDAAPNAVKCLPSRHVTLTKSFNQVVRHQVNLTNPKVGPTISTCQALHVVSV